MNTTAKFWLIVGLTVLGMSILMGVLATAALATV